MDSQDKQPAWAKQEKKWRKQRDEDDQFTKTIIDKKKEAGERKTKCVEAIIEEFKEENPNEKTYENIEELYTFWQKKDVEKGKNKF